MERLICRFYYQISNLIVFYLLPWWSKARYTFSQLFYNPTKYFQNLFGRLLSDNWRVLAISDQINFDDNSTEKEEEKCKKCPLWKDFVTQLESRPCQLYMSLACLTYSNPGFSQPGWHIKTEIIRQIIPIENHQFFDD